MKILLLVTETEKEHLKRELFNEELTVATDVSVLENLGIINPQFILFTMKYVEQVSPENIIKTIKFAEIFLNSKIKYLLERDTSSEGFIDPVYKYMISIGNGNSFIVPIQKLSLKVLKELLSKDFIVDKEKIVDKEINYAKLDILRTELKRFKMDKSDEILIENKADVIGYLDTLVSVYAKLTKTEKLLEEEKEENRYLNKELISTKQTLDNLKYKLNATELKQKQLTRSVLENLNKIEEFNQVSMGNTNFETSILPIGKDSVPVIYFKELEDIGFLKYFNQLVYLLQEIQEFFVKVIIIEDNNRVFYDPYSKLGYNMVPKGERLATLIDSDKIIRYGNAIDILYEVTRPEYKSDAILIFDRSRDQDLRLVSEYKNILPFYLGHNKENYKTIDIDDISWVSYKESKWEDIKPFLEPFNEFGDLQYNIESTRVSLSEYIVEIMKVIIGG